MSIFGDYYNGVTDTSGPSWYTNNSPSYGNFVSGFGSSLGGWFSGLGSFGSSFNQSYDQPQMSDEEKQLLSQISELIQQQSEYYQTILPIQAHQLHYKIEQETYTDPDTGEEKTRDKWVKLSDEEWYNSAETTDAERQQWDLYTSTLERQQKALAGEIPLTQSLIDQKQQEFNQLKNAFSGITGTSPENAVASDTVSSQNLAEFNRKWGLVEESQRTGQLGLGGQLLATQTGLTTGAANQEISTLGNIGNRGGLTQQYYSLLEPYMGYNQTAYQAYIANQANQSALQNSLIQGGALLGAAYLASSRHFKKRIKKKTKQEEDKALKGLLDTASYEYRYRRKMRMGEDRHLGTIAEESPREYSNGTLVNLGDKIEYIGMGVKSLARKVDRIERRVS